MRWSSVSLLIGTALLLFSVYLRLQPTSPPGVGPEIDAAPGKDGADPDSGALIQVKRQYAFRIDFDSGDVRTGKLVLTKRTSAEGFSVLWDFSDAYAWDGIALPSDGFLVMATDRFPLKHPRVDDVFGVAIYRITGGQLKGSAIEDRRSGRGQFQEILTGPATLGGRYEIQSGGATSRLGYVQITPKKGRFLFARIGDHPVMTGVGVRIGDLLIVSYSSSVSPQVMAFCRAAHGLNGLLVDATLKTRRVTLTEPKAAPISGGGAESGCQRLLDLAAAP